MPLNFLFNWFISSLKVLNFLRVKALKGHALWTIIIAFFFFWKFDFARDQISNRHICLLLLLLQITNFTLNICTFWKKSNSGSKWNAAKHAGQEQRCVSSPRVCRKELVSHNMKRWEQDVDRDLQAGMQEWGALLYAQLSQKSSDFWHKMLGHPQTL